MPKIIDANSPLPVRLQLREMILGEIREGVFPPDRRIPSERDLAVRYQASRSSVREAIAELISEGVLSRTGGRGYAVAKLGAARARGAGESRQVGFWISEEIFHFVQAGYTRILTGAEELCREQGFTLRFHSVNEQKESLDLLFSSASGVQDLAGHIVVGGLHKAALERLQGLGAPLTVVDPLLSRDNGGADSVRIDYADGTRQAVRYLAGLGHREIGFIGFPGSEKYEAFWRALEELGLPYSPRFVQFLQVPDLAPSALSGYQCAARLLAAPKRPTALLVSNDYVAMGAIDAAGVAGVAVPEDLSVVGFDDLGQSGVQLTTVRVNLVEAGRVAAQALLDRLANPALPVRSLVLPVELVVRGSTAALPAAVAQAAE